MESKTLSRFTAKQEAIALIKLARSYEITMHEMRVRISDVMGHCGSPNKYPISGGICEHWHPFQKKAIFDLNAKYNQTIQTALNLWIKAGCRTHTFRTLLNETHITTTK